MESDFSTKELLIRLDEKVERVIENQRTIERDQTQHIEFAKSYFNRLDEHIRTVQGKVVDHEKRLEKHSTIITKATTYASLIAAGASIIINKYLL